MTVGHQYLVNLEWAPSALDPEFLVGLLPPVESLALLVVE